jgi:hypothetical protein
MNINEAFSSDESKEIYDKFLAIVNSRRDNLVKKYGKEAERVAYASAVNQVKKKAANSIEEPTTEEPMDTDQKLKEMIQAALSKPLDEGNFDSKDFQPYVAKDINNPNFLKVYIKYPTGEGFTTALGQRTMSGQEREYGAKKALQIGQLVAAKLESKYNLEDIDVYDNEDGKVIVFAVSDDFINMNKPELNEKKKSFPDLTGDGKVTKADILKARGVIDEFETGEELIADEPISEDLDIGHQDNEPHMIKAELYQIGKYAMDLYKMMDGFEGEQEVDFPAWLQSKITTAKNMMSSVKHYLEFETKEPQIDAVVTAASEEGALDEKMSKKQIKKRGEIYDTLKDKGMSDKKAGKISTSQAMKAKIKEAVLAKLKK